jgi:putative transcriptional regulator
VARFLDIRRLLGLTQAEMAEVLGCVQSNVSFLDRGQALTPDIARRLIDGAAALGVALSYDHVYGQAQLPPPPVVRGTRLQPREWERVCADLTRRGWTPLRLSSLFGVKVSVLSDLFHGELEDPPHALGTALLDLWTSRKQATRLTAQVA